MAAAGLDTTAVDDEAFNVEAAQDRCILRLIASCCNGKTFYIGYLFFIFTSSVTQVLDLVGGDHCHVIRCGPKHSKTSKTPLIVSCFFPFFSICFLFFNEETEISFKILLKRAFPLFGLYKEKLRKGEKTLSSSLSTFLSYCGLAGCYKELRNL